MIRKDGVLGFSGTVRNVFGAHAWHFCQHWNIMAFRFCGTRCFNCLWCAIDMRFASWTQVFFGHILTVLMVIFRFVCEQVAELLLLSCYTFDIFQTLSFSISFQWGPAFSWNLTASSWRTVSKHPVSCKSLDYKVVGFFFPFPYASQQHK